MTYHDFIVGTREHWEYEPSDTSVGIMSDGWTHLCDDADEPDWEPPGVEEMRHEQGHEGVGVNHYIHSLTVLTCACGAQAAFIESDWDPDYGDDQ